jgi:hypothetical protein
VAQAHADLVGDIAQRELLVAFVREHGLLGDDDVHLACLAFDLAAFNSRRVAAFLLKCFPVRPAPGRSRLEIV